MGYWEDLLEGNIDIGSSGDIGFANSVIGRAITSTDGTDDLGVLFGKAPTPLPVPEPAPLLSGTRVSFVSSAEAMLAYSDFPTPLRGQVDAEGTVVKVRTASGDVTALDGRVFVMWDDGLLRAVAAHHLKPAPPLLRQASSVMVTATSLGDLTSFFLNGHNELVNKSTQDLWSYRKEGETYVVERLFDSDGSPLKGV